MGNCLVTKLKGVVDNADLLKMGDLRISVYPVETPTSNNRMIYLGDSVGITVTCDQGSWNGTEVTSDVRKVIINPKYNLDTLLTGESNTSIRVAGSLSDVVGYANIRQLITCFEGTADISAFRKVSNKAILTRLKIATDVQGDIANFSEFSVLNELYLQGSGIYGNIANLGNCLSLSSLEIEFSKMEGSLQALAQNQVANGRTSGSLRMAFYYVNDCKVTVDGTTKAYGVYTITFDPNVENGYTLVQNS